VLCAILVMVPCVLGMYLGHRLITWAWPVGNSGQTNDWLLWARLVVPALLIYGMVNLAGAVLIPALKIEEHTNRRKLLETGDCPGCKYPLAEDGELLFCSECGKRYTKDGWRAQDEVS